MSKKIFISCIIIIFYITSCTSKIDKYYPNGKLKFTYNLIDGKVQGERRDYYPSGELKCKSYYVDNELNGEFSYFFIDGNVWKHGYFVSSKLYGEYKTYSDSGYLKQLRIYARDTIVYEIEYDRSGKVLSEIRFAQFEEARDTINLGERFQAKVMLTGPKNQDSLEAFAGFSDSEHIKYLERINGQSDYFLLDFLPEKEGQYKIVGLIKSSRHDSPITPVKFTKRFFVKGSD